MTQAANQENTAIKLKAPNKYNIIMLNDESTPMDFVVQILMVIYRHDLERAKEIMLAVHEKGRCIVGTYSFEIAEQKSTETITESRSAGYPLDVIIEENE